MTTDGNGRWSSVRKPVASTVYRATFDAVGDRLGVTRSVTVSVAPKVRFSADKTHGARHATYPLATHVSPDATGQKVTLQRWGHGRWHNARIKRLVGDSDAAFTVKPDREGTFSYRVLRPADATHARVVSRVVTLHVR